MGRTLLFLSLVAAAFGGEQIVIIGGEGGAHKVGFYAVDELDTQNSPSFTVPVGRGRHHGSAVYLGRDRVIMVGGEGADDEEEKSLLTADFINLESGEFSVAPSMREFRSSNAGVGWNGKAYICGGLEGHVDKQCSLDSCEIFDGQGWLYAAPMNAKRGEFPLVPFGGFLYAFGGNVEFEGDCKDHRYHVLKTAERYSPGNNYWEKIPEMPKARYAHGAAAFGDDIWVCGGHEAHNASEMMSSCDKYNPRLRAWTSGPAMVRPRQTFRLLSSHGRLFAVGGSKSWGLSKLDEDDTPSTVEVYDPKKGGWRLREKKLPFPVYGAGVTLWPSEARPGGQDEPYRWTTKPAPIPTAAPVQSAAAVPLLPSALLFLSAKALHTLL